MSINLVVFHIKQIFHFECYMYFLYVLQVVIITASQIVRHAQFILNLSIYSDYKHHVII